MSEVWAKLEAWAALGVQSGWHLGLSVLALLLFPRNDPLWRRLLPRPPVPPEPEKPFMLLIAEPLGHGTPPHLRAAWLAQAFADAAIFQVETTAHRFGLGHDQPDAEEGAAASLARTIARQHGAMLLLCAHATGAGSYRLWFDPLGGWAAEPRGGALLAIGGPLLAAPCPPAVAQALQVAALLAMPSQNPGRTQRIDAEIRRRLPGLEAGLAALPAEALPARRLLRRTLAEGLQRLADGDARAGMLDRAIALWREDLAETDRAVAPLDWAGVQHSLGDALHGRAGEGEPRAWLEAALAAHAAAAPVFEAHDCRLARAMTAIAMAEIREDLLPLTDEPGMRDAALAEVAAALVQLQGDARGMGFPAGDVVYSAEALQTRLEAGRGR